MTDKRFATTDRLNQPLKGIGFAIVAIFVLSVMDALVKWLTSDFAVVQILFVRSIVMAVPVLFILYRNHGARGLYTHRPVAHLIRLLLNLFAFVAFFYGLSIMPLADTVALMLTAPIFLALLSGPLLGEYAHGKIWLVIAVGFIGVLLMVGPGGENTNLRGALIILAASVIYALWMIQTRHLAATELSETMVFYSAVGIAIATAFTMPWYWQSPDFTGVVMLILVGLVSALGHTLLVQAYRYAPVYIIGPFDYTALVWAILIGFIVWQDIPSLIMLSGAALVIGCGFYLYLQQK